MWRVLNVLKARGIWFTVCSPEHLKVGTTNYWPRTGRIFVDGAEDALPQHGLAALLDHVASPTKDAAVPPKPEIACFELELGSPIEPAASEPATDPIPLADRRRSRTNQ
jgi:hypothetical protein